MIALSAFGLLRPLWLLGLPLIAAGAIGVAFKSARARDWERAVDSQLLQAMVHRGSIAAGAARRNLVPILVASAIVAALAGPALERRDADSFRNLDATLLIVDLSNAVGDEAQLQQERIAARTAVDSAATRQVGLIVYAGDAYVAHTLTTDGDAVGTTISALEADTVPDPGNRPARALALARRLLRDAGVVDADVLLISAGDAIDASTLAEAKEVAADGYRLHTWRAAAPDQAAADAEPAVNLAALASSGNGEAAVSADPSRLLAALRTRPIERLGAGPLAMLAWKDFGRAVLLFAAGLSLLLFRRRTA